MPTTTSIAHELWTADEFLDWLEPGVFADLIDGEILMHSPVSLLHAKPSRKRSPKDSSNI